MIILRKVRGISGLTPLFRRGSGTLRFAGNPATGGGALAGPLAAILLFGALLLALVLIAVLAHAPWHVAHAAPVGAAGLAIGSIATELKEHQDKIAAKQQTLHEVFEKAGETVDFAKPDVLQLVGAKDSTEAVAKVRELNKELEELGKKRDELAEMKAIADRVERERTAPVNQPPHPSGTEKGNLRQALKSIGEIVVGSRAFKAYRDSKHPSQSEEKDFGLVELKTLFQTTQGWAPESTRSGLVVEAVTRPIQLLDIIPSGPIGQAQAVYMEETTFTNNAAERAEAAAYAESAFALTERRESVRSIGTSVPVTDEQLEDVAQAQTYLDGRLSFGVRQRLDGQLINGDGNAPNLTGILNKAGIQTQARGADPNPDAFYKAMTNVRVTGRAFPNAHVIHPTNWQSIRLMRTADGIYIWGSPAETGPDRMWGLQVVQADSIAAGTGIVGDFLNFCQLYERRGLEVAVGYVNDDFLKGKRTVRAGIRVAFAIYRAAAFSTVTGLN